MLTVACVLKSGGIYDASWVAKLKSGVAQHLPTPHRFLCLSDVVGLPCERIPLKHDWPGWWAKIELFRLPGPVLFFDLDTVIVGDLTDIAGAAMDHQLIMLRDFYRKDGLGSGMIGFDALSRVRRIYDAFDAAPLVAMENVSERGDQGFVEDTVNVPGVARWQTELPGQIVSYKVHCRGGIPEGARVVCLHGKPKFMDMPANDPVRKAWEMAA